MKSPPEPAFADDRLAETARSQEAALASLRATRGQGYGKPVPGSATDLRGRKANLTITSIHRERR